MADTQGPPALPILTEISKLDVQIALLSAQKKKLIGDVAARKQVVDGHAAKSAVRAKVLVDKQTLCAKEEKSVKHERDRINERRAALNTLNNYKLQQAAEREIDYVAKQIGQREDLLLGLMREIEVIQKEVADADAVIRGLSDELTAFEKEASETIQGIDAQLQTLQAERTSQAAGLAGQRCLVDYNRIKDRFPSNPIVEVLNRDSCAGCFMKLGPQVIVQVSRGDVVKCPGCSRILRLAAE
jgi:predicted  nucleic acid-binding Zn-ribbon protein